MNMKSMIKTILFTMLLALAGQSAFALQCEGKIYVQIPDDWTTPYIMIDGAKMSIPATAKENGWYVLDALTYGGQYSQKFWFMKADFYDSGITTNHYNVDGWSMSDAFTCAHLSTGTLYIYEDPTTPNKTVYGSTPPDAKYFFVMIPPDMEDWMTSVPMISMDGGLNGKPMTAVEDLCGWYSYVFFGEEITDHVVLYRDDDLLREDMIGLNGNWETAATATPIPLGQILENTDTLFFVPDQDQKTNEDGLYYSKTEIGGIEGTCSYSMAAIIYDTDAKLHPAFSCYSAAGEGCQAGAQGVDQKAAVAAINSCIGVHQGLVEDKLDPSKPQAMRKPKLSAAGRECFINETYFNQMFSYTPNVNEKSCYDLPFKRSSDGKWEFDSDFYHSPGTNGPGGFYPAENNTDAIILAADPSQKPLEAARMKRTAEGPVFYGPAFRELDATERVPKFDILCNGPGWNKGKDCEGKFSSGSDEDMAFAIDFVGGTAGTCVMGWSCSNSAPTGWHFFKEGTDTEVDQSTAGASYRWTADRNQHYCFESHARFTHKPNLKFSFRGSDDVWVFIDNKLAVDLGGTHFAAPGYVDLDNFKGYDGNLLTVGNQYDIDIFFCDRRTTMNSFRIKTNMYIQQKTAIDVKGTKNKDNPAETSYDLCYTKTGDGSCASAMTGDEKEEKYCGAEIKNANLPISYTLVQGNTVSSPAVPGFENVSVPDVYKCGIDLTSLASPKVDKSKVCLGGGRYTLFINIDGKTKKVASFRVSGELDVVYANGVARDTNGVDIPGGKFNLKTMAMGGEFIPVYISNVAPPTGESDELDIFPDDAKSIEYTLSHDKSLLVYKREVDPLLGTETYTRVRAGEKLQIGESGIDTVYVTVSMEDMTAALKEFKIGVAGREKTLSIYFYMPQITFVEKIPEVGENAKAVSGQTLKADGSYDEYWVGSIYDMYLAIVRPNPDGTYSPCVEECNGVTIHSSAALTSPGIDFIPAEVAFVNGYATVSVRSLRAYRWDTDPTINYPAKIVAEYNDYVQAVYTPIYFREPPMPFPVLADVFDVRGAMPSLEHKIPEPYFSMSQEYLDGIGDSIAIYYDRRLHQDSLPTKICVMWDSASAEEHNPVEEGYSNIPKDVSIACNALLNVDKSNIDCSNLTEYNGVGGYCTNLITIGNLELSKSVKTAGVGKVHSYAIFQNKGRDVKQGFAATLTDRIAPVPLRAELGTIGGADYDSLVIIMSEPVKLVASSDKKSALDFYLNSATDLSEENRYASALEHTSVVVSAESAPALGTNGKTGEGRIKLIYKRGNKSPQVGDYVRLGGNMTTVFWSDTTDIAPVGTDADMLRKVADASYYWNSPTAYNETKRLPSIWVPIVGRNPEINENDSEFEYAKPSFRVRMTGPFQFTIVMDESVAAVKRNYAVMDLQGRVVRQGEITSAETAVPLLTSGSYVVKVGIGMRRVNVR